MMPPLFQERYQSFRQTVVQVRTVAEPGSQPSEGQIASQPVALQAALKHLQQQFQSDILTLDLSQLDGATAHQVQAFQIEMDKQVRLLGVDALFLQAARQSATAAQRQQQMRDRLAMLIRYCDGVLGEGTDEEPEK